MKQRRPTLHHMFFITNWIYDTNSKSKTEFQDNIHLVSNNIISVARKKMTHFFHVFVRKKSIL